MPSESIEYIVPFLKSIKEDFGNPYTIVRDMSSSIRSAAGEVFPGTCGILN
jgi:MULE transposase domain.